MKPFRLQTVLEYRKRREDEVQKRVMIAREHLRQLLTEREAMELDVSRLCQECAQAKLDSLQLPEIMLYEQCIAFKKQQILASNQRIDEQETRVHEEQKELVQARQEKRILEKLKEKRRAAESFRLQQEEKKVLDEIAVLYCGGNYDHPE